MNPWFIIKTDNKREDYVSREIRAMNFETWVPVEISYRRSNAARTKRHVEARDVKPKESPIRPGYVFIQADYAPLIGHLNHVHGYLKNADGDYAQIPDSSVQAFRKVVDDLNEAVNVLRTMTKAQAKPKWQKLADLNQAMIEAERRRTNKFEDAA